LQWTKYPDENYAREFMQLFTIGVWELNAGGTKKRDPETGRRMPTYNNDDIMDGARVEPSSLSWQSGENESLQRCRSNGALRASS
jgi:uncharacterized protein (DUF1800 family)